MVTLLSCGRQENQQYFRISVSGKWILMRDTFGYWKLLIDQFIWSIDQINQSDQSYLSIRLIDQINRSIYWSINRSIKRSINWFNQTINQSNQSIIQSLGGMRSAVVRPTSRNASTVGWWRRPVAHSSCCSTRCSATRTRTIRPT